MKAFTQLSIKRKISFIVFLSLTVFILWFIFFHSAKPAVESSKDSEGLSHMAAEIINFIFNTDLTSDDTAWFIRTFAHFAEFAALSFCISGLIESFNAKNKVIVLISFPFTVTTAISDETVQLFYEGRAFQLSDVFIDSLGGLTGIIVFALILKIFSKCKERIKK